MLTKSINSPSFYQHIHGYAGGMLVKPARGNYAGITSCLLRHIYGRVWKACMVAYPSQTYYLHLAELHEQDA